MKTEWQEIAKRVAKNLDIPEKEVIEEIKEYTKHLREGIRKLKKVDFDFYMVGKLKPSSKRVNEFHNKHTYYREHYKPSKIEKERQDVFFNFFERWEALMKKGRWKVKGQFNPFK
jgi:hypothetical protein